MEHERLYKALELSRGRDIMSDTFQLEIDLGHRINNINLSSEVTYIIKEAGRLCDSYASDVFYDLRTLFTDLEGDNSVLFEQDKYQWVVGIRDMGCDHDGFIDCAVRGNYDLEKRYRAMYEIHIEPDSKHWYRMTLSVISLWRLQKEYDSIKRREDREEVI